MDDGFELPVVFQGGELLLSAQLHHFGYTYKIEVEVQGNVVFFERDEERNWRVLADPENHGATTINYELIVAVANSLEELFK